MTNDLNITSERAAWAEMVLVGTTTTPPEYGSPEWELHLNCTGVPFCRTLLASLVLAAESWYGSTEVGNLLESAYLSDSTNPPPKVAQNRSQTPLSATSVRATAQPPHPIDFACVHCGARPGEFCVTASGWTTYDEDHCHSARKRLAL